jgi:hypothetical protein
MVDNHCSLAIRMYCDIHQLVEIIFDFLTSFLDAFAALRKAITSFIMSVCSSVAMEQLHSHMTNFHELRYLRIFRKSVENIQVSSKWDKNNGFLREDQYRFLTIFRSVILIRRNVSVKNCRGNP